jgi:predicted lysophospholipase L1 biosynthesis ABC-type transport system permease subunit
MGGQPLALGIGLAAAAVLSLALTVLGLVLRRRHELALLKTLGMTRGQVRAVIAWQTTLTLLIAVVVLGLAALVLVGNLLAELPAAMAARTRPAVELRTE